VASHRSAFGLLRTLLARLVTFHRVSCVLFLWVVVIPTLLGVLTDLLLSPLQERLVGALEQVRFCRDRFCVSEALVKDTQASRIRGYKPVTDYLWHRLDAPPASRGQHCATVEQGRTPAPRFCSPGFPYRRLRIQGGQGRGGLGYRLTVQAYPYC
jgi:hypothetical protein